MIKYKYIWQTEIVYPICLLVSLNVLSFPEESWSIWRESLHTHTHTQKTPDSPGKDKTSH